MEFTRDQIALLRTLAADQTDPNIRYPLLALADSCDAQLDLREVPVDLPTNEEVEEMFKAQYGTDIPF